MTSDRPDKPRPSLLCVVRHAEALKNLTPPPANLSPEQLDALTPNGIEQARRLGAALPQPVRYLLSSPAQRARQTAKNLGVAAPLMLKQALRPLEGDVAWDARVASWAKGEDPRPEGGETLAEGAQRALEVLTQLRLSQQPDAHAVVVTHGDIAAILLGQLRGTPLLARPTGDEIATGEMVCLPLPPSPLTQAPCATEELEEWRRQKSADTAKASPTEASPTEAPGAHPSEVKAQVKAEDAAEHLAPPTPSTPNP